MADFFFFTDTDLLNNQNSGEDFGPAGTVNQGGTNYDAYRTTSIHTATADPKAYAITKGQVFIQDVVNPTTGGPDLVNLVLKPEFQPEFNLPYIKFYIYKGIRKDSLINTSTNEVGSASNNDLTTKIWAAQNQRNLEIEELTGTNPNDTPSEKALGIQYTATATGNEQILDDEPLEKIYLIDTADYQLTTVEGGNYIGDFDKNNFGLEVILERSCFQSSLELARKFENQILVEELPGSPTQAEEFKHWNKKENILAFIDPCAFYGSFYGYLLNHKENNDTSFSQSQDQGIYNICLFTFLNRNSIYIDIRNNYGYSLNYFQEYGHDLKLSYEDILPNNTINYYISGWPILKLGNSNFPSSIQSENVFIRIAFQVGNRNIALLHTRNVRSSASFPNFISEKQNYFKSLAISSSSGFTQDDLKILSPNYTGNSNTEIISSYYFIYNLKMHEYLNPINNIELRQEEYWKNTLFWPFTFKRLDFSLSQYQQEVVSDSFFADLQYYNESSYMYKTCFMKNSNGDISIIIFQDNDFSYQLGSEFEYDKPQLVDTDKVEIESTDVQINDKMRLMIKKGVSFYNGQELELESHVTEISTEINPTSVWQGSVLVLTFIASEFSNLLSIYQTNLLPDFPCAIYFNILSETWDDLNISRIIEMEVILRGYVENNNVVELTDLPTGIIKNFSI